MLLSHLVSANAADYVPEIEAGEGPMTPIEKLDAAQTLNAQLKTSEWMKEISSEDDEIISQVQEHKVGEAFAALSTNAPEAKNKLLEMQVPEEIRATVAMVSAYQWKFLEQAEQLRNMAVAKIVKETDHPDARIRLKALDMLGKVTEVALFTDRIEIKRTELSDEDLEKRIKAKLDRVSGVVDAEFKEMDEVLPSEDSDES